MAKPLKLSQYPSEYYRVVELAARDPSGYETQGTMEECMALRFDLYAFRRALQRENHPHRQFADPLKFFIHEHQDGTAKLIILKSDRTMLSRLAAQGLLGKQIPNFGGRPPGMDEAPVQPIVTTMLSDGSVLQPDEDPMESALEKLGFFAGVKKREEKQ